MREDPSNPLLLIDAIDVALEAGDIPSARAHCDTALELFPEDPQVQHRQGNVLLAQGQLAQAQAAFEALLASSPDVNVAYGLAYALSGQGQHQNARAVLQPYVEAGDPPPHVLTLYLRMLHHLREIVPAIALAMLHAGRCSSDADFLAALSLLHLDNGELQEAQRLSLAALSGEKRPLAALAAAGTVALGHNDAAAATALFEEAVSRSPQDGRSWAGLGMASLLKNDLSNAREQLRFAEASMPKHIGTLHALGWCQLMRRELEDAGATFQRALALDRNFADTHGGLAAVAALQGNQQAAQDAISLALRLDAQCLSARFAQMVLAGDTADPVRFKQLAMRILAKQAGPFGVPVADILSRD
ncbi:MAG: hypothetical protein JWQ07_4071 [Ramlibacter sp.]|nr:hypothetical protein [Ramlibacter sp.]